MNRDKNETLHIFSAAHFYLACDCGSIFPVFFIFDLYYSFLFFIIYCTEQLFNLEENSSAAEHSDTDNIQSYICKCENKHLHLLEIEANRSWYLYIHLVIGAQREQKVVQKRHSLMLMLCSTTLGVATLKPTTTDLHISTAKMVNTISCTIFHCRWWRFLHCFR